MAKKKTEIVEETVDATVEAEGLVDNTASEEVTVVVVKKFKDIESKKIRKVGETFACTKERMSQILEVGPYVELVEQQIDTDSLENEEAVAPVSESEGTIETIE